MSETDRGSVHWAKYENNFGNIIIRQWIRYGDSTHMYIVCGALRCYGLHARYTGVFSKLIIRFGVNCLQPPYHAQWWGSTIAIVIRQRGIPNRCWSSAGVDYAPALCTHRPSLLPIEWSGKYFRSLLVLGNDHWNWKYCKPYHLEEGEVVTRFP